MMGATMSFLGMYNYDPSLFSDLQVPAGVDKNLLVDNFLIETAELEVLYADPDFMKQALKIYSGRQISVWEHLAETFDLQYNPIWNVDGSVLEKEKRDLKHTDDGTATRASSGTQTGGGTSSGTLTTERAGFNSSSYGADEKETSAGSTSTNVSMSENENKKDSRAGTDTGTIERETVRTGNIGVTTTQQMLREELDTRPKLNIYAYIIEDLKSRFCLLIY